MLTTENLSNVEFIGVVIPLPYMVSEVIVDDVTVALGISGSEQIEAKGKLKLCPKKE